MEAWKESVWDNAYEYFQTHVDINMENWHTMMEELFEIDIWNSENHPSNEYDSSDSDAEWLYDSDDIEDYQYYVLYRIYRFKHSGGTYKYYCLEQNEEWQNYPEILKRIHFLLSLDYLWHVGSIAGTLPTRVKVTLL